MTIYWGDLHNHCGITYGFGSLENALARAESQLDFCAITGHAMWPDMYDEAPETKFVVQFHLEGFKKLQDHWCEVRESIAKANKGNLVTFQGYEMHSSEYGDHHFISKDDKLPLIYKDSPQAFIEACGVEAIAIPHHIGYTPGYRGIDWNKFSGKISPVVEVYSKHGCAMSEEAAYPYYHNMGPRDTRNMVYEGLKKGNKFGFVASTDHHAGFPGSYGDGLVAAVAEEKTRESIWEALKARRTYAVTGDKIKCDFRINEEHMGSEIRADQRKITYHIETEYALDKIILYKNLKPLHILNGEMYQEVCKEGKYKLRIEMGWGDKELYAWKGKLKVEDGKVEGYNTCFRGRNVLAPSQEESYDPDHINAITTYAEQVSPEEVLWACDTVGNKSNLHPTTSAIVVEIAGHLGTKVTVELNEKSYTATIEELMAYGFTNHMAYYHSHAFKIHRALPKSRYCFDLELEDNVAEKACDVYHVEVAQKNGHWAYVSPIFVNDSISNENV